MPISLPGKSKSSSNSARRPVFIRAAGKKILYLGWAAGVIALLLLSFTALSAAQEELPEIPPQQQKPTQKNDKGPRAIGLVQLSSNGKATLVPITIRIDGRFHDAASYKANPVPMALESGTVYEGERSGASVGLFTVNGALHSNAVNAVTPWIGTGMWLPTGTDAPKTAMKAESVPRGIETSDQPPRLAKNEKAQGTPAAGTPSSPPAAPTNSAPSSSEPAPSAKPSPESKPTTTTQPSQGSATPPPSDESDSGARDANRPRLRRGKPTQPLPTDEDVPGYSKPGSAGDAAKNPTATPADGVYAKGSIQLYPAVSDAGGPDPRSYVFEWIKGEGEERRKQMLDLAQEQLHLYLKQQAKGSIAAAPAAS